MRKHIIVAVIYSFISCPAALAETEDKIAFSLTSDFYSKYIWRGQLINDDFVFQPSISAGYKGFTANVWGNVDLTDYHNNSGEFTEYDLTLDYRNKFSEDSKVGYSVGVIHYHFPSASATDTIEFYWGFNFDVPLKPAVKIYHGLGNENGTYVNFSLGHTLENIATFSKDCYCDLQLGTSLGWSNSTYNKDYWGVDESRLNDLAFTIGLPICFANGWAVKPSLNYVTLVDGAIRKSDAFATSDSTRDSDYFFTGVSISKSF
jgi:uncharacterized protein (TIGR02001 family)